MPPHLTQSKPPREEALEGGDHRGEVGIGSLPGANMLILASWIACTSDDCSSNVACEDCPSKTERISGCEGNETMELYVEDCPDGVTRVACYSEYSGDSWFFDAQGVAFCHVSEIDDYSFCGGTTASYGDCERANEACAG